MISQVPKKKDRICWFITLEMLIVWERFGDLDSHGYTGFLMNVWLPGQPATHERVEYPHSDGGKRGV